MNQPVIEAALCRSAGLTDLETYFKPEVLEAADQSFSGGLGIREVLLKAASANGWIGGPTRITSGNIREVLRAAYGGGIQAAGLSTIDVSGILSNTANKLLLAGFASVENVWADISKITPLKDFKAATRYRLTADLEYEELGKGGNIEHGTLGEETYRVQAKTYAKMLTLDRQDIINDDLGAFDQLRQVLGRGAGLKINRVFWTEFLNNATFFTSARGNYTEGAGTALSLTSLAAAEVLLADITDANGNPLGLDGAILLTPKALSPLARQIFVSTELREPAATTEVPTANIFKDRYKPLSSSYLSNSNFAGNSALAWYLLADPRVLPTVEIAFLNGRQAPTIESSDADFSTLGIQLRGYHDFGVSKAEWRAGVKSKGEA